MVNLVKNVIKRDGRVVPFDKEKIIRAIEKAMNSPSGMFEPGIALEIATEIEDNPIRDK